MESYRTCRLFWELITGNDAPRCELSGLSGSVCLVLYICCRTSNNIHVRRWRRINELSYCKFLVVIILFVILHIRVLLFSLSGIIITLFALLFQSKIKIIKETSQPLWYPGKKCVLRISFVS